MSDATSGNDSEAKHSTAAAPAESGTDMVTTADFATFQQQLRQEMADVIQQLRVEVSESISGRVDMLNSINTALQNVSEKPTDSKPCRISDLLPRNWEGSIDKG